MWLLMIFALGFSFALSLSIIKAVERRPGALLDSTTGPQKFHTRPTPRVGGVPIFIAFAFSALAVQFFGEGHIIWWDTIGQEMLVVVGCSIILVVAGLTEDITKKVPVVVRLGSAMIAGALAFQFADAKLQRLDVWFLDILLQWPIFALAMSAFCAAGIANALNIIDGYNGLSGGYAICALLAMASVASQVGDAPIMVSALVLAAAIAGFIVLNFPYGRIFLGDAGAYFVGFMIAVWSILLVRRHPDVSPWFPLMIVAYPVWETLFSIYRKKILRKMSAGQPDGLHLHMLVYKRLVRWPGALSGPNAAVLRNAMTAPYLWLLSSLGIVPAMMFWNDSIILGVAAFVFGGIYNALYREIVRFRVPRWIVLRGSPRGDAANETSRVAQDDCHVVDDSPLSNDRP